MSGVPEQETQTVNVSEETIDAFEKEVAAWAEEAQGGPYIPSQRSLGKEQQEAVAQKIASRLLEIATISSVAKQDLELLIGAAMGGAVPPGELPRDASTAIRIIDRSKLQRSLCATLAMRAVTKTIQTTDSLETAHQQASTPREEIVILRGSCSRYFS